MQREEFIEACREGGPRMEAALRAMDRSYAVHLIRLALRSVRDQAIAQDIVQGVLIRAWQRCAQFRGESELIAWLKSILRHQIVDHLRQRRPEEPLEDEDGAPTAAVAQQLAVMSQEHIATPERELQRKEVAECLVRQYAKFHERFPLHAAVMQWVHEDGLTSEAVGVLLGRTPGATREFISQARKKARLYFAECHALAFGVETEQPR
jgi:RNA polymerase sigma factor (sigma-70 family)